MTLLLDAAASGDSHATDQLFPLVYDELHRIASALMARERGPGPYTLQPTALVHEAYMKLVGPGDVAWQSKAHFFGAAARAMRHILIDRARRVKAGRGKPRPMGEDDDAVPTLRDAGPGAPSDAAEELLHLDECLESLRARDQRQYDVVMLRFFGGLSVEQTSAAMGLSPSTIKNEWSYARAWLLREVDRRRGT